MARPGGGWAMRGQGPVPLPVRMCHAYRAASQLLLAPPAESLGAPVTLLPSAGASEPFLK